MGRDLRYSGTIRVPSFWDLLLGILEYLWVVAVVLNGNSVYNASALKDHHLMEWCVVLTIALLAVNLFLGRIRLMNRTVIITVFIMLYGVVYLSVRQSTMSAGDFGLLFVVGLPCLLLMFTGLHQRGELLPLMCKLGNVVCFLAVISLFFWILGGVLGLLRPNMTMVVNWGYTKQIRGYNGLYFMFQRDTTFFRDASVYRNSGIFTEAPMQNLWLDIALAIELFIREKPSKTRVTILTATIFSTVSLTGILFLAICVILRMSDGLGRGRGATKRTVVLLGLLVVLPALIFLMYYSLTLKSDTRSYNMRLSDYVAGVKLWLDHPVFGAGYGNLGMLQQYTYSPDGLVGFSNSVSAVLGTGGLWVALLFYVPLSGMLCTRWTGNRRMTCFGICFLFLFCTTTFFARYIAVVMIAFEFTILLGSNEDRA